MVAVFWVFLKSPLFLHLSVFRSVLKMSSMYCLSFCRIKNKCLSLISQFVRFVNLTFTQTVNNYCFYIVLWLFMCSCFKKRHSAVSELYKSLKKLFSFAKKYKVLRKCVAHLFWQNFDCNEWSQAGYSIESFAPVTPGRRRLIE
jgi:hypothetical protein